MEPRSHHGAGIVTDEVTDEHFVAATGGFGYLRFLDSTEILQDGEWVQGKINDMLFFRTLSGYKILLEYDYYTAHHL